MTDKPTRNEEEFFAREEAEKLHRLHQDKLKTHDVAKAAEEKQLHWMKCPKCGYGLEEVKCRAVDVDKCFRCGVVVLDAGELETLAGTESAEGFLSSFSGLWKKK
jgi:ribosomal protein L37AE/L43A